MNIKFYYSNENFKIFDEIRISKWIGLVVGEEKKKLGEISYNIVSDAEILEINQKYLNHDYFTDIITFDDSFVNIINGDIFLSFETVKTNSKRFKVDFIFEFNRVIIHGIMHLCGYSDHTEIEKSKMRDLEEKYIAYLDKL